jgi:nicotinamidase-related amidase
VSRALIVVDMLNTYAHPDGERCAQRARDVLPAMCEAIDRAREDDDTSLIWANDNYDLWTSDRAQLVDHVLAEAPDRELIEPVLPRDEDELILKARHSIFYETSLAYLLSRRDVTHLTLVGQVTEQCILYSALDAHVRHFEVAVITGAVIAIEDDLGTAALRMMERNMRAELL